MAKRKGGDSGVVARSSGWVPARAIFANCTVVGCGLGYTAKTVETAGFHCICGAQMTWNNLNSDERPAWTSDHSACEEKS